MYIYYKYTNNNYTELENHSVNIKSSAYLVIFWFKLKFECKSYFVLSHAYTRVYLFLCLTTKICATNASIWWIFDILKCMLLPQTLSIFIFTRRDQITHWVFYLLNFFSASVWFLDWICNDKTRKHTQIWKKIFVVCHFEISSVWFPFVLW